MYKINKAKMKYNKPWLTLDEPKKFVVKACQDGPEKIIRYGDPNMKIRKSNPKVLKSFRARFKCRSAKSKLTARYWSSRNWYYFIRWRQTHFYFCRSLRSRNITPDNQLKRPKMLSTLIFSYYI